MTISKGDVMIRLALPITACKSYYFGVFVEHGAVCLLFLCVVGWGGVGVWDFWCTVYIIIKHCFMLLLFDMH